MLQGDLFTRDFLQEGITSTEAWKSLDNAGVVQLADKLTALYASFPKDGSANEAHTEQDLIFPILEALGWASYLPQQTASQTRRTDVPDALLFLDPEDKKKANTEKVSADKYRHGIAILENKAWGIPLDRAGSGKGGVPSTQILRYLSIAEVQSEQRIQWGILTDGRYWRLYWQKARSRAEEFLELDVPALLGLDFASDLFTPKSEEERLHWLRVFVLMFRCESFALGAADARTFHGLALDEGKMWEERVAKDLSDVVFGEVFPSLVQGIIDGNPDAPSLTPSYLAEVKDAALTLLYRLLFVLYAEDRELLPVRSKKYDDYGMREPVRQHAAKRVDEKDTFSGSVPKYHGHLQNLFNAIDKGDSSIGLPPYNGGLFDPKKTPLLEKVRIGDAIFTPVIDKLSRHEDGNRKRWINYRDLTVQQLGSIYERLLEHEVVAEDGNIAVRPNIFARKGSGSYYTPDSLVRLIIERTLDPLIEERRKKFTDQAGALRSDKRTKAERLDALARLDTAAAILDLKVCDPAMGSGHFLVSLVDYLADKVLEAMAEAEAIVDWADEDAPYHSPVADSIAAVRHHILEEAAAKSWEVKREQLDDRLIVRRSILKRVIYGVDKNPMAVELAKVALWLHTFTVGAPLSFLDHHLRCGDSLFGEWVRPAEDELAKRGAMYLNKSVNQAKAAAKGMAVIEALSDADIAEVRKSAAAFQDVEADTHPLHEFLGFYHALRWMGKLTKEEESGLQALFDQTYGDPVRIAAGLEEPRKPESATQDGLFDNGPKQADLIPKKLSNQDAYDAFMDLRRRASALSAEQRFLHWEVAFPGVWGDWESADPDGGFHAVIGNPPWDRIKLQEVEWFETRKTEIAHAPRASDRKKMVKALKDEGHPLVKDYETAQDRAESAARVCRSTGQYPLLSKGDVNLYSLFVERAQRLIRKDGVAGLLVPSGIAADLGASAFFKSVATTGRLAALLDFENRRPGRDHFFPDVDSRFKFCAFITGGIKRTFEAAACGFFLHDTAEVETAAFPLGPADFDAVNPNTGTAPIFRTRRDAALTTAIYKRVPILVDHRENTSETEWPVKYSTLLHMAIDSDKFHTVEELATNGCYRAANNLWKKGEQEFVPLYEGKMVQMYDHRAAHITVNESNLFRPGQTEATSLEEHADPRFCPTPRFFVASNSFNWPEGLAWVLSFKDVTASTNVRTMIASVLPFTGAGHTLPVLFPLRNSPDEISSYKCYSPLLMANFNAIVFDYITRQKVGGNHLTWFIVEQLPILPRSAYTRPIGTTTAEAIVRDEVLKLTYTAVDMEPFARDMGYEGPPFPWDEEERRHSRARLDALYFILYGLERDDADYILSTFPIVQRQDEAEHGRYLTRDLIRAYMAAFKAGDAETRVVV